MPNPTQPSRAHTKMRENNNRGPASLNAWSSLPLLHDLVLLHRSVHARQLPRSKKARACSRGSARGDRARGGLAWCLCEEKMQEASSPLPALSNGYQPLPSLYLGFLAIWAVSGFSWAFSSWRNRHFQVNNLQWILALVPLIKALQMALSFLFWYSCVHLQTCSLWMSFGAYVTGILFQTASFVSFMLISHGYCIMCERLSIRERRTTAVLGCLLYLSLIGYKAAVPYFTIFLLINYFASFYIIFRRTSQNLIVLQEQLSFIEEEDIHSLHGALNTKYTMFKRFQGTMQVAAVAFIMVYMRADDTPDNYWFRVLVREWVQFCIFMYIGWNFRIPEASLHLPVIPLMKSAWEIAMPPIYSVEMDAADFKGLVSDQWHVGVRTGSGCSAQPLLVLVQNPSPSPSARASKFQLDRENQV